MSRVLANKLVAQINDSADSPTIQWGGSEDNSTGTGLFGDIDSVQVSANYDEIITIDTNGLTIVQGSLNSVGLVYDGEGSYQPVGPDLELDPTAGSDTSGDPSFLAAVMGNIIGDDLLNGANYLAGVIGAYSITGTKATSYPAGGVLAQISDGVTEADGAVVAYIDGDSEVTIANAAFKAMSNNSNPGSGFTYGVDLHGPAHDGYSALAILKADIRMSGQVCIMSGAGAPTNGTTGDNFAEKGSLYIDVTNGKLYIQGGAITNPDWKIVTSA